MRTVRIVVRGNFRGDVKSFLVTDATPEELNKSNFFNTNKRPPIAEFPISSLYDEATQGKRAELFLEMYHKTQHY